MENIIAVGLLVAVLGFCVALPAMAQDKVANGAPNAEKLGWRVGCQAYSFNRFTFFEAVDKSVSMGLKVIEAYPGQTLSADHSDIKVGHDMSDEGVALMKQKLDEAGIKLVNYGVVELTGDEAQCRKVFDWAKKMGIETIVSEPPYDAFDVIEPLCEEYAINVAIHNHPKPSKYWDYEKVLEVTNGRSKRIGSCADTGHWMRSDINPLEAVKALEGRIISFHMKDLNKFGRDGEHDVPWGTGEADVKAILAELKRQGFQGVFSAEYEHNWENSVPDIAECVKNFDQMAKDLQGQ
ncbi:MAG TPA: sugar phosphate isomerase/epimerase [Candidatus Hydrogenedentes bacterium]|nr:sugar phosphate isomerase/epimerase [Candidatus Hydrogenedentota bacterium]HPG66892.1 sugar phosphate isomerase/epimerase [Candidatus Hydrogenedentota bacterium]